MTVEPEAAEDSHRVQGFSLPITRTKASRRSNILDLSRLRRSLRTDQIEALVASKVASTPIGIETYSQLIILERYLRRHDAHLACSRFSLAPSRHPHPHHPPEPRRLRGRMDHGTRYHC